MCLKQTYIYTRRHAARAAFRGTEGLYDCLLQHRRARLFWASLSAGDYLGRFISVVVSISTTPSVRDTPLYKMLKRKSGGEKGSKSSKKAKAALSKAEVSPEDDVPEAAVVPVAEAAVAPKAATLKDGIAMLNADEATKVGGRTRSLYADAKLKPKVSLAGAPGTGDPYPVLDVGGKNLLTVPAPTKMAEVVYETPVFPLGFVELDPVRAVAKNNNPDTQYRKANSADVVATVNINGEELFVNDDFESSRPGINLLYHLSADILCQPSHANVFPDEHIQEHRAAALTGDDEARSSFIAAGLVEANRSRGPPYLPCKASKAGAHGTLKDALKAADREKYKMTTKFFTYPAKDAAASGPHQPSIDLARRLGGDDVEELVAVLENPDNHGRQLKLVPIYDEHNKPVPVEMYRETVNQLRGGAITARVALRIGGKSLGPKDRTAHVAAYINKICIVKRGDVVEQAPSGGGIASFMR